MNSDNPEDQIPLPSEPVLSEEETGKQLREDYCRQYRERIKQLEGELGAFCAVLNCTYLPPESNVVSAMVRLRDVLQKDRLKTDEINILVKKNRKLLTALAESVKLQSHYAMLLNAYDGGQRIRFNDAAAWIARLRETGTIK
jgi:hypothetical protein